MSSSLSASISCGSESTPTAEIRIISFKELSPAKSEVIVFLHHVFGVKAKMPDIG
jgi:hypothetical protein